MGVNFKKVGENASNTDFQPLPENRYNVKITAAVVGKTKNENDMITVTFDVTEGKYTNRKLWSNFTLTEKAYVYLFSLLKAIGSDLIDNEDVEADEIAKALIGGQCSVMASIESNTQTGKPRNTIGNFKSLEEAGELAEMKETTLFE
jgi:hypothetical protein